MFIVCFCLKVLDLDNIDAKLMNPMAKKRKLESQLSVFQVI